MLLEASGDPLDIMISQENMAGVYCRMGRYPEALNINEQVLASTRMVDNQIRIVDAMSDISNIYQLMGDTSTGIDWLQRATVIAKQHQIICTGFNSDSVQICTVNPCKTTWEEPRVMLGIKYQARFIT